MRRWVEKEDQIEMRLLAWTYDGYHDTAHITVTQLMGVYRLSILVIQNLDHLLYDLLHYFLEVC